MICKDLRGSRACRWAVVVFLVIVLLAVCVHLMIGVKFGADFPCPLDLSVPLVNATFYGNGSASDSGILYPEGHHFSVNGTFRGCLCSLKPCVRKCCGNKEHYVARRTCGYNTEYNFDNLSLDVYKNTKDYSRVPIKKFGILYGNVCYHGMFPLDPSIFPQDKHYLMEDGRILRFKSENEEVYMDATKYCLDSIKGSNVILTFACANPVEDRDTKISFKIYPMFLFISTLFLFSTFLVYCVLPELQNSQGKSQMCHILSLFVAYVGLIISNLKIVTGVWCIICAFIVQFSFLASFFWLNVMCFDIWLVFSDTKPVQGRKHKKFLFYSLYAWGVPFVIVAISIGMDMIPGIPDSYIKPRFGKQKCWFADNEGTLLYFYLPIAVVVVMNIIMFVSTAIKLRAHTRSTKVLNSSESRRTNENDRDRFILYLKLFIIMGINWVMELVSFFVGGPKSLWFVPDLGNTLQGVLIFVIFVCKRRILRLLNEKLCPQWQIIGDSSTSGRSKVSSTRTNSSTVSKTISDTQDNLALKPIARNNQDENDE